MDNKKEEEKTNKYNFQGQSARSIRWFDLDHECLEGNFSTREPDFYKKTLSKNIRDQDIKTYQLFVVPIDNAKITEKYSFSQKHQC